MVNRQKGQLRIGTSGPIIIGNQSEGKVIQYGQQKPSKVHRKRSERARKQADAPKIEELQIMRLESVNFVPQEPFITHGSHIKNHKDILNSKGSTRRKPNTADLTLLTIEKFDGLVEDNKDSGRYWYYGLEGRWWWGLSENEARKHIVDKYQKELQKQLKLSHDDTEKKALQVRTIGEIIDEMKLIYTDKSDKYKVKYIQQLNKSLIADKVGTHEKLSDTELPKDMIRRISYIYPGNSTYSFNIVASNHIKYLRHKYVVDNDNIEIEEVDWSQLSNMNWNEKRNILIHPFLYQFSSYESFMQNSRNFAKLLATKQKIGGFDVADSNKISKIAVDLINKIDLIMVPSNFAKDAYVKSGVTIPVEVLPHGVPDEFLSDCHIYTDNVDIIKLRKMKEKGNILILYFLVHSSYRKGADLVKEVMKRIQNRYDNVYLVIKGEDKDYFSKIRSVFIESWMTNDNLRLLYDTCDILLSPSRGGGFELNALEGISRGVITLTTGEGCFADLMDYFIGINVSRYVCPLSGNSIHVGVGPECDINDFEKKLEDVIVRLDYWKKIFRDRSKEVREKYAWKNVALKLENILKDYDFVK